MSWLLLLGLLSANLCAEGAVVTPDQSSAGLDQAPLALTITLLAADVDDDDDNDDDERIGARRFNGARERSGRSSGLSMQRLRCPRCTQRGSSRSTRAPPTR